MVADDDDPGDGGVEINPDKDLDGTVVAALERDVMDKSGFWQVDG